MLDPVLEVDEMEGLRNHLAIALKELKTLRLAISSLMVDMSAIRRTVLTTPETKARYKKHLAGSIRKARPLIDEAMQSYDNLIQKVGVDERSEKETSLRGSTHIQ
jgi:hypothetical protein